MGFILIILSFVFIVRRMQTMETDFSMLLKPTNILLIAILPIFSVITIFCDSYCWKMVLSLFTDNKIWMKNAFAVYAKANAMKYLPGNVGHYAGRQLFGTQLEISQIHLAIATFFEIVYGAISMVICALLFSARMVFQEIYTRFGENTVIGFVIFIFGCMIIAIIFVTFFKDNPYVKSVLNLLKETKFWIVISTSLVLFSVASMVYVLEYVLILRQFTTFDFHTVPVILSANFVAIFIGYITPGAPGGIGVREAVLMALLLPYVSADSILFAAITQRIISILGDVICVPISLANQSKPFFPEK